MNYETYPTKCNSHARFQGNLFYAEPNGHEDLTETPPLLSLEGDVSVIYITVKTEPAVCETLV